MLQNLWNVTEVNRWDINKCHNCWVRIKQVRLLQYNCFTTKYTNLLHNDHDCDNSLVIKYSPLLKKNLIMITIFLKGDKIHSQNNGSIMLIICYQASGVAIQVAQGTYAPGMWFLNDIHVKPSGHSDIFVKLAKSSPYSRPNESSAHYLLTEASAQWRAAVWRCFDCRVDLVGSSTGNADWYTACLKCLATPLVKHSTHVDT